ncbi:MAG: bifunctional DNA primase/polymerase [Pseudonocardiales bacterium]|nr:bifunctional DNA primase/polymerase [Pseudonocardiales bacterium]
MMRTTEMTLGWKALRDAAVSATRWGWPVTPGTFLCPDQRWYGRDDARRLCPIEDSWRENPVTDSAEAYEIWSEHPYGVLLVCGRGMDALELPQRLRRLLAFPEVPRVPLAMTAPPVRWLLFTATGSGALSGELASAGVRLHTAGTWVALPPTTVGFLSPQRWLEPPQHPSTGRLRTTDEVQHGLLTALLRFRLGTGPRDDDED